MATKRMFSNDIVGSDAFLEMPSTSQTLYFHLGMRCDDDGFVNPNVTMRMTGANKNDLDILIAKRFLLAFKNGVVVIKHNRINNNWDSRDSKRTLYTEELAQLFLKENRAYTLDENQGVPVLNVYPKQLPTGTRRENEGFTPLEEKRREEIRIDKKTNSVKSVSKKQKLTEEYEQQFQEFWVVYPEKVAKGNAYETWKLLDEATKQACITAIKNQVENNHFYKEWKKEDVPPHPTTWLNQRRWEDNVKKIIKPEQLKTVKV